MTFIMIIFAGVGTAALTDSQALFLPAALVLLYGVVVAFATRRCGDFSLAEHHIDSVYFLGFLFTLISLLMLFTRVQFSREGWDAGGAGGEMWQVFSYVGVSVSTSIAGVLMRAVVRSFYLHHHPENSDSLERSYELLARVADQFSSRSGETFDGITAFLRDRQETQQSLAEAEEGYRQSIERFVQETDRLSTSLSGAGQQLAGHLVGTAEVVAAHRDEVEQFLTLSRRFAAAADDAPVAAITSELQEFRRGVAELNLVIDSLVDVLEQRVGQIR